MKRSGDKSEEGAPLLEGEPPKASKSWASKFLHAETLVLLFYVVMAILSGTANRVSFRLMQYSMMNYSYFVSQITTFIYIPVNFTVIAIKLLFTDHITPEMTRFPKWKFLVMGLLDSLQGLLIVVGGRYVPGIMQNLLLQGAVPVTMLFSLFMLRYRGDATSITARHALKSMGIRFREVYAGEEAVAAAAANGESVCRILVNGRDMGNISEILRNTPVPDDDVIVRFFRAIFRCCRPQPVGRPGSIQGRDNDMTNVALFSGVDPRELDGDVVLVTDAHTWSGHFRGFYSITQYLGALIIMVGLVVSVWPAISGAGGAGPIEWDLVFFSSTALIAISGVYKEIAFQSVSNMDVWYLNGWVALPQFVIGLLYAPLAAVMTDLPVAEIPQNLWRGLQCWLVGTNFISQQLGDQCSAALDCGIAPNLMCCDSCDGSLLEVSAMPALYAVFLYMGFNIAYNVFLVLVIKHGSAALMYASSTVVLPLGSVAFTITALLGKHAQPFNMYTGFGLGIVIFGLIIYRFVDMFIKSRKQKSS